MAKSLPKFSVVASKLYDGKLLIGTMVSVDLPSWTFPTTDVKGNGIMGTIPVPTTAQLEGMEMTIKLQGTGKNGTLLCIPGIHNFTFGFMQDVYQDDSLMKPEGTKVYAKGIYVSMENGSVENGSPIERSAKFTVLRYQEYCLGEEVILIDQDQMIYRINGFDHMKAVRDFLNF